MKDMPTRTYCWSVALLAWVMSGCAYQPVQTGTAQPKVSQSSVTATAVPRFGPSPSLVGEDGELLVPEKLFEASRPNSKQLQLTDVHLKNADAASFYSAGLAAEAAGDSASAIESYEKVIALDPTFIELRYRVAHEYMRKKKYDKALELINALVRENQKSQQAWMTLVVFSKAANRLADAEAAAIKAVQLDPTELLPYQYLYEVYMAEKKYSEALVTLEKASKHLPSQANYWLKMADMYAATMMLSPPLITAQNKKVFKLLIQTAQKFAPDDIYATQHTADLFMDLGEFQEAIDFYRQVLVKQPHASGIHERIASAYAGLKQHDKSITELEEAIRKNPMNAELHESLASTYAELKQYDKAISAFEKSIQINPAVVKPYISIALVHSRNKNPEAAIKVLTEARTQFPVSPEISYVEARIQKENRNFERSIVLFEETITRSGGEDRMRPVFFIEYASTYEVMGDDVKAAQLLKKAIDLDDNNPLAMNYLGYMWADKGKNLEEAQKLIEKAVALDPDNGAFLDSLGWVYFKMGKYDAAVLELKKAVSLMKLDDDVVFDHLAEAYFMQKNFTMAIKFWDKAALLNPEKKDDYLSKASKARAEVDRTPQKPAKKR
ncbi:MAG: tetratricopeptide repeat protein [Verrucomicrobiota bacterium]|nr:tetratricopeptide repeat protein [Verrucomicrobiota bacterium]